MTYKGLYYWMDLHDKDGKPNHGKIVGFWFFVGVLALKFKDKSFTVGELVVIAAALFGPAMFYHFLKAKAADVAKLVTSTGSKSVGPADGEGPQRDDRSVVL